MAWSDFIAKIKLPSGTVGKICFMGTTAAISLAVIVVAVHQESVAILAVIVMAIIVLSLGISVIWFAHKHPDAAILDGAEFIKFSQQQYRQSKFTSSRIVPPSIKADKSSISLTEDQKLLLEITEEQPNG
jgi:hypothetical protein